MHPVRIEEWGQVAKAQKLIQRSRDFGTVVIDTAEAAYECAWRYMQRRDGWEHPNDVGYGKAWDSISRPTLKFFKAMLSMPDKGCLLLSHAKTGTRATRDGDEFEDIHPNLSGKMLEEVAGLCDVVGYYHFAKGQTWLRIRQTEDVYAKCRLEENFLHTDGSPVKIIPMGNSKTEAYAALLAAFNNELPPPEKTTAKKKVKLKRR